MYAASGAGDGGERAVMPGDRIAAMDMTTSDSTQQPPPSPPIRAPRPGIPSLLEETVVLVATVVIVAASSLLLGPLWSALSPRVELAMSRAGAMYDPETEVFAAADGWFIVLGAVAGVVAAVLCWLLLRRYRGPLMLLAVVLGGAGAALATWQLGTHIGESDYEYLLSHAQPGWQFSGPLQLNAKGGLAVQALASALVYTVIAGCSRYATLHRDRRPRSGRTAVPDGYPPPETMSASPVPAPTPATPPPPGPETPVPPASGATPPPPGSAQPQPVPPAAPPSPQAAPPAPPEAQRAAASASPFEAQRAPEVGNHGHARAGAPAAVPEASSPTPPWVRDQQSAQLGEKHQAVPARVIPSAGDSDESPTIESPTIESPTIELPAETGDQAQQAPAPPPDSWPKAPGRQAD